MGIEPRGIIKRGYTWKYFRTGRGDTLKNLKFKFTDENGEPINLSGSSAVITWRRECLDGTVSWTLSTGSGLTISTETDSVPCWIVVDPAIPPMEATTYYGDLQITWSDGSVQTVLVFQQTFVLDTV